MPIRTVYEHFDAPRNPDLPVLKTQPEGRKMSFLGPRTVWQWPLERHQNHKQWFFCPRCEGWIEGEPFEHHVNTLAPEHLAGRKGIEYYCIRCGEEIYFSGLVS